MLDVLLAIFATISTVSMLLLIAVIKHYMNVIDELEDIIDKHD